jgi:hypothetical protein
LRIDPPSTRWGRDEWGIRLAATNRRSFDSAQDDNLWELTPITLAN